MARGCVLLRTTAKSTVYRGRAAAQVLRYRGFGDRWQAATQCHCALYCILLARWYTEPRCLKALDATGGSSRARPYVAGATTRHAPGSLPAKRMTTRRPLSPPGPDRRPFLDGPRRRAASTFRRPLSRYMACWFVLAAGCGGPAGPPTPDDPSRLRGITTLYSLAARELGRPPKNVDELKAILAPATDDPSIALTSTRDQQEFVIVWGLDLTGRQANSDTIVAYERTGVEGKRMVVDCRGEVREVTPDEFKQLKFPKGHTPTGG